MSDFDQHDWDAMHDVILGVTGRTSTQQELEKLFEELPSELQLEARRWGMLDTVWRDELFTHLEQQTKQSGERADHG